MPELTPGVSCAEPDGLDTQQETSMNKGGPGALRCLVVDDDAEIRHALQDYLQSFAMQVTAAADGVEMRRLLGSREFDLVILDLMLPGEDGLSLCRWLRQQHRETAIIMLTAQGDPVSRIVGLEMGADDYLAKPFEPRELLARVRALLRRAQPDPDGQELMRFGRLEIDLGARQARIDGQPCDLTGHQFDLLVVLARSAGRVLSRDQIMDALKGHPMEAFDRSIDVHVSRIRACIEDDAKCPRRLLTVRGSGYVFARKQDGDAE